MQVQLETWYRKKKNYKTATPQEFGVEVARSLKHFELRGQIILHS